MGLPVTCFACADVGYVYSSDMKHQHRCTACDPRAPDVDCALADKGDTAACVRWTAFERAMFEARAAGKEWLEEEHQHHLDLLWKLMAPAERAWAERWRERAGPEVS